MSSTGMSWSECSRSIPAPTTTGAEGGSPRRELSDKLPVRGVRNHPGLDRIVRPRRGDGAWERGRARLVRGHQVLPRPARYRRRRVQRHVRDLAREGGEGPGARGIHAPRREAARRPLREPGVRAAARHRPAHGVDRRPRPHAVLVAGRARAVRDRRGPRAARLHADAPEPDRGPRVLGRGLGRVPGAVEARYGARDRPRGRRDRDRVPDGHQTDALNRRAGRPASRYASIEAMVAHDATTDAVPAAALKAFGDRFDGRLFEPSSAGYDEARTIWNGAIDRRPGLIARCADASDVVAAVRFALEHDLRTSVRSGGHGVGGLSMCDDGLVIDLSAMRGIRVDGDRREARVDAGVTLGELDRAAQAFGLAVPAGIVTHTGVAGLTLGGGIGWLTRKHGLTVDNLLEAEVVTADAELVRASDDENADLLWGLKGGGGNFGVVTAFRFRAHPIGPTVVAGPILFPLERTAEVMHAYRDWARDAPDELTTILNVRRSAGSWVPEHLEGVPVCIVIPCWCGPIEEGIAFVEPIRRLGPILDLCEPRPWLEHQAMFDGSVVPGWHYYWKSVELDALSPD